MNTQQNYTPPPPRKPRTFWPAFFGSCFGVFITGFVCTMLLFVMMVAAFSGKGSKTKKIAKESVLHLKLDYDITDRTDPHPFAEFDLDDFATQPGLVDLIRMIRYAATDDKIKGIYLDAGAVGGGLATMEELRKELVKFKESGKFIYTYGEYFSQKGYYLASVSDEIYLHPLGGMEFKGLAIRLMFYKRLLDKIGVQAEIFRPTGNRFKSAVEPFFLERASDANRVQLRALLDDFWDEMVEKYAEKTGLSVDSLNAIANTNPFIDEDHPNFKAFISGTMYFDEFANLLKSKLGQEEDDHLHIITTEKYYSSVKDKIREKGRDKIAIVYAEGEIVDGKGRKSNIGGDTFAKAIREAREDDDIKAVILRVNSPGGSAMASDIIWREVVLTREVKPVIVSMGNYAASGGYYISCAADTIVADRMTLTGSIGVFSVALNTEVLMEDKLGLTSDTVKTHSFSDFPNGNRKWTDSEKSIYQDQVDKIYITFLSRVAEGRDMEIEEVDSIAQGRVWTGVDAKELGLVDVIGDLEVAMDIAKKMIGSDDVEYEIYPDYKDKWDDFLNGFSTKASSLFISKNAKEFVKYYEFLEDARNLKGHQTRMPFAVEVY